MYFPIIRGRQFELIALRELVENSLLSNKIIPIIEPVKLSSTLIKTIETFKNSSNQLALILNPQVGDLVSDLKNEKNLLLKDSFIELVKDERIIVAHYLNLKSEKEIDNILDLGKNMSDIISICLNPDFISMYGKIYSADEQPLYNLIPDDSTFRRKIRYNRVCLADKFNKQHRNVDYANNEDELFSEDHLYYKEDGYIGFSDYSIIGSEYSDTGFAPYAVAIHIVYFDEDLALRIKHFISDSNDDIRDPARKFAEALHKLKQWNTSINLDTHAIKAFLDMYSNEIYPGLGTVKKLSLMHHLELMSRFLDGEL